MLLAPLAPLAALELVASTVQWWAEGIIMSFVEGMTPNLHLIPGDPLVSLKAPLSVTVLEVCFVAPDLHHNDHG